LVAMVELLSKFIVENSSTQRASSKKAVPSQLPASKPHEYTRYVALMNH